MFFMFYILVFNIYFSQTNSSPTFDNIRPQFLEYFEQNEEEATTTDKIRNATNHFSTMRPLFSSATKKSDLISNMFDKMLSDEMFSIKQKMFEKDLVYTSRNIQMNTQSSGQTPTLEIKQKWAVVDMLTKKVSESDTQVTKNEKCSPESSLNIDTTTKIITTVTIDSPKDVIEKKSLDVRNIPPDAKYMVRQGDTKCSCMKTSCGTNQHNTGDCTRSYSYSVLPFYMPYEPYFVNNMENEYQTERNRVRKTKRRKTTRLPLYDDEEGEYRHPHRYGDNVDFNDDRDKSIVVNVDYNLKHEVLKGAETPPQMENNVNSDLDRVYNDSKAKKCFCSKSYQTRLQKQILSLSIVLLFR